MPTLAEHMRVEFIEIAHTEFLSITERKEMTFAWRIQLNLEVG